ncbi:MAG: ATP-binding cassette domain-containing protein [Chromatiales bacterium]|jgi:putative ABC transport system ATP-binding protein
MTKRNNILIQARDVSKQVKSPDGSMLHILMGIDLHVNSGEAVALLGASGSGKSTLLGLLAGLDLPSNGEVNLLGQSLAGLDEDQRARLRLGKVGFVFQSFQLIPGMTALENVALPLQLSGADNHQQQARQLLSDVGLGQRMAHLPQQLSGGEQQRVALARAFAGEPKVLFADEPTGNLDAETGAQIAELLFDLRDRCNTALLMVTHDEQLASRCDRIYELHAGHLKGDAA